MLSETTKQQHMEKNALLHGLVPPLLCVLCFPDCLCETLYAEIMVFVKNQPCVWTGKQPGESLLLTSLTF